MACTATARPQSILQSRFGARYVGDLDALFDSYAACLPRLGDWARAVFPKDPADSDFVYKQSIKAKACDAVRGMLPAATLSNVGIYGTGQAFEALLLRMRAHPLPEARSYASLMLTELRKVIPSFLTRVDRPDRGIAWSRYLEETREETEAVVARLFGDEAPVERPAVTLTDFDPDGEDKVLAAICYPHVDLADDQLLDRVRRLATDERASLLRAYVGERSNRRHRPGRALERTDYRFDVMTDYGAFRDLQRHRMLTIEWQTLSPRHGYEVPAPVHDAGLAAEFEDAMARTRGAARRPRGRAPARGPVRGVARVSHPVRDADERARGDARAGAAERTTGSPVVPGRVPGDAPAHRGARRSPRARRGDVARRS